LGLDEWGLRKAIRSLQVWTVAAIALLPGITYNIFEIYVVKIIGNGSLAERIQLKMLLQPITYLMVNNQIQQVLSIGVLLLSLVGGLLLIPRGARGLMIGLWGGYLTFGLFFIYYYATHDYYQLPLIPIVALGLAPLGQVIMEKLEAAWPRRWLPVVVVVVLVLFMGENVLQARNTIKHANFSAEPAFWQSLGDKLRNYSLIALTDNYNVRLSYWGWTGSTYWLSSGDFAKRVIDGTDINVKSYFDQQTKGKDVFLITMLDELNSQPQLKKILDRYPILMQGDRYIVYDLKHPMQ
jgi:hypothetical protein